MPTEVGKVCKASIRVHTLLRFMARHADRPVLQCTAPAERFGIAETNTWNFFRAHTHNIAREEGVLVWNRNEMWEVLRPFRKSRSPIERDHWHHGATRVSARCPLSTIVSSRRSLPWVRIAR